MPQLQEVFLHGNPWVCSCSILPLWRWLGHNRDKVPGECSEPPPAPSSLIIPNCRQAMGLWGWGPCGCSKVSQKPAPLGWICPWVWSLVPPSSGWWLVSGHQQGFPAEADWVTAHSAVPSRGTSPAAGRARGDRQWAPEGWASPLTWPGLSSSSPFPSAIRRMGLILHFFLCEPWREAVLPAGISPSAATHSRASCLHWGGFLWHLQAGFSLLPMPVPREPAPLPCLPLPLLPHCVLPSTASTSLSHPTPQGAGHTRVLDPHCALCALPWAILANVAPQSLSSCPGLLCPPQTCPMSSCPWHPAAPRAHHRRFSLPEESSLQCVFPEQLSTYPIMAFRNESFRQCQETPLSAQRYATFLLLGLSSFLASIIFCTLMGFIVVIYQHLRKEPRFCRRPLLCRGH